MKVLYSVSATDKLNKEIKQQEQQNKTLLFTISEMEDKLHNKENELENQKKELKKEKGKPTEKLTTLPEMSQEMVKSYLGTMLHGINTVNVKD